MEDDLRAMTAYEQEGLKAGVLAFNVNLSGLMGRSSDSVTKKQRAEHYKSREKAR